MAGRMNAFRLCLPALAMSTGRRARGFPGSSEDCRWGWNCFSCFSAMRPYHDLGARTLDRMSQGTTLTRRSVHGLGSFFSTKEINMSLKLALTGYASMTATDVANAHGKLVELLDSADTPFDGATLDLSLRLARRMPRAPPRVRLAFALRMLQRARAYNVSLNWRVMMHFLALAQHTPRKVNMILALNRMIELQFSQREDQMPSQLLSFTDEIDHDIPTGHDSAPDVSTFYALVKFFMRRRKTEAAVETWKKHRMTALAAVAPTDLVENVLSQGIWICVITCDDVEAKWIARQYKKLGITPDTYALHLLVSACIRASDFAAARAHMRHICRLGYVLHERQLREYVQASMSAVTAKQPLDDRLFRLSEILTSTKFLCSAERNRLRLLRAYFHALYASVLEGRLTAREKEAGACAQLVFDHWKIDDNILASYMTYLACQAGRLDVALRVVQECHFEALCADSTQEGVHESGLLYAFAYEALIEQSVKEDRVSSLLALIFGGDIGDALNAKCASYLTTNFIRSFGRLGRLDICSQLFDAFSHKHVAHASVTNAYMSVLSAVERFEEAVCLFRALQISKGSGLSAADDVSYSVLGKVILDAMRARNGGGHADSALLPIHVVNEMLAYMEDYLRCVDLEVKSEKSANTVDLSTQNFEADELHTDGATNSDAGMMRPFEIPPDRRVKRARTVEEIRNKVTLIRKRLVVARIVTSRRSADEKEDIVLANAPCQSAAFDQNNGTVRTVLRTPSVHGHELESMKQRLGSAYSGDGQTADQIRERLAAARIARSRCNRKVPNTKAAGQPRKSSSDVM